MKLQLLKNAGKMKYFILHFDKCYARNSQSARAYIMSLATHLFPVFCFFYLFYVFDSFVGYLPALVRLLDITYTQDPSTFLGVSNAHAMIFGYDVILYR